MYQTRKQEGFQSNEHQHGNCQHFNLPCQHRHHHHHQHRHYRCFRRCGLLWLIFFTMIRASDLMLWHNRYSKTSNHAFVYSTAITWRMEL
uniref:Uncharacterized protein n=1 Tax=Glossina pallidipes TaxID=7398 RepID=A0A1A9ZNM2_GLOPL